jgi:predicted aspartyl protease
MTSLQPGLALAAQGPVVRVTIGVSEPIAEQLRERGEMVPTPVSGLALIDTGTSTTCIAGTVAHEMGLPVSDVVKITSAANHGTAHNVYAVQIEIDGLPIKMHAPRAIGVRLEPGISVGQQLIALLGRDVLYLCTLFYNGPSGEITLSV